MATTYSEALLTEAMDRYWAAQGSTVEGVKAVLDFALGAKPKQFSGGYREFSFRHDDFHLNGLFNICEPMLVEASIGLRGFKIESVRRFLTDDHAVDVPTCVSDFVAAWAETNAGKAKLQAAYEASLPDDGQSYAYKAPQEHQSIWQAVA